MTKLLRCRDVGFDCDAEIRAESEEEVLEKAARHASEAHGIHEMPDEVLARARAATETVNGPGPTGR